MTSERIVNDEKEEGEIGDDDAEEFNDGFDENLFGDEDDKRKLASMTEKEREQVLFERGERREVLKSRFKAQRKILAKRKKEEEKEKKPAKRAARGPKRLRAAEIYSSDESSEDSDEYTPDNIKSIVGDSNPTAKPANKIVTRSALLSSSSSSSSPSESSASSESSDEEHENDDLNDDDDDDDNDSQGPQDDFQMTLSELKSLQLKREKIEKWIYEPFFRETAIGLFVKISIGLQTGSANCYKVGQILDIKEHERVYSVNTESDQIKTNKTSLLRIGKIERSYTMNFVSNKPFDEEDFVRWLDQLHIDGHQMPTREHYIRKLKDIDRANNYIYNNNQDIEQRIKEKNRFKNNPCNFALQKTKLMGKISDAEADNDLILMRKYQNELDELEEKARQLEKERSSKTFSAISFVNERNRHKNIVECEKALKESKIIRTEDPFTRRKCTPQIVHNRNNVSQKSLSQSQVEGGKPENNSSSNSQPSKVEVVSPVDDLFQAHADIDLDLDIDIL